MRCEFRRSNGSHPVREGKYRQALDHDRQAIELFRGASNRPGLANSLNTVGLDYAHLG
jgi:hypothetical protein